MANTVDNRVVQMQFDNGQFEKNIKTSMNSLDRFKEALNFEDSAKSFEKIEEASSKMDFSKMEESLAALEYRFSAMGIVGMNVINKITDSVIGGAKKITGFLTTNIFEGGWTRAANIEQAKFQLEGLRIAWEKVSDDIDYAVSGTAYGLDAAANACAQLSASGVQAGEDMKKALRGISGVAAMANTSYEEISPIFTTVAGQGKLMTMQLRQLESRGLNAAAELGKALGKTEAEIRDMVTKGKIDFATFADAMDSAFGEHAKDANKTFDGALANMKAALKKIGAEVAGPLRLELRDVFNSIRETINTVKKQLMDTHTFDVINNVIHDISVNLQKIFKDKNFGKITLSIIKTMNNLFADLLLIIDPIKKAFHDIFPKKTSDEALRWFEVIEKITAKLYPSREAAEKLRRTFRGLFSVIDILGQAFSAVLKAILPASKSFGGISDSILDVTASIGDFVYNISRFIKENDLFTKGIEKIKSVLALVAPYAKMVGNFIAAGILKVMDAFDNMKDLKINEKFQKFGRLAPILQAASNAFHTLGEELKKTSPFFQKIGEIINKAFETISNTISENILGGNFERLPKLISGVLLGGIAFVLGRFVANIGRIFTGGFGLLTNLGVVLFRVQDALSAFAMSIRVDILMTFAKAIGILTLSLIGLSMIDGEALNRSLKAVTIIMLELVVAVAAINHILNDIQTPKIGLFDYVFGGGFITNVKKAASITGMLTGLATAVALLTGSVYALSTLDPQKLEQGLRGMSIVLVELVGSLLLLGKFGGEVKASASSLIGLGIAVNLLYLALKNIGSLNTAQLQQGLGGMAAVLVELSGFFIVMNASGGKLKSSSKGLLIASAAMVVLAGALKLLSTIDAEGMTQALNGFSVSILLLSMALGGLSALNKLMGVGGAANMLAAAKAMLDLSAAMDLMALALKGLSTISFEDMGTALAGFAGALLTMTVALGGLSILMKTLGPTTALNMIAAAGAMVIMAAAFDLLTPAILALGAAGLKNVAIGVGAFVVSVLGLAVAGRIAQGAAVGIIALGGAIALIGAGVAGIGAGVALFAAGVALLTAAAAPAAAAIGILNGVIIELIASIGAGIAKGIVEFAKAMSEGLPTIIEVVKNVGEALLDLLISWIPKIGEVFRSGISEWAKILSQSVPELAEAGLQMIVGLLESMRSHIGEITTLAILIVTEFVNGLSAGLPAVIDAGMNYVVQLIDGMASGIENNGQALEQAIEHLIKAILTTLTQTLPDFLQFGIDILKNIGDGVLKLSGDLLQFFVDLIFDILKVIGVDEDFVEAGRNFMHGLVNGLTEGFQWVIDKVTEIAKGILSTIKGVLKEHSPSLEGQDIGNNFTSGVRNGLDDGKSDVEKASEGVGKTILNKTKEGMSGAKEAVRDVVEGMVGEVEWGSDSMSELLDRLGVKFNRSKQQSTDWAAALANAHTTEQYNAIKKAAEAAGYGIEEEAEAADDATNATTNLGGASGKASQETSKLTKATESLTKAMNVLNEKYKEGLKTIGKTIDIKTSQKAIEGLGMSMKDFGEMMTNIESKVKSAMDNIFDAPKDRGWMDKNAILSNMRENIAQVEDWVATMNQLSQRAGVGLTSGLYKKLAEMGPEGYKYVKAFTEMTDDELQEASALFQKSLELPSSASTQIASGFLEAGLRATQGFAEGLDAQKMYDVSLEGGQKAIDGVMDGIEAHSPSEATKRAAGYFVEGFTNGLNQYGADAAAAAIILGLRVYQALENQLIGNDLVTQLGQKFVAKLAAGMLLTEETLTQIIQSVVDNALLALESRAKEINQNGREICKEIVKGFREEMDLQQPEIDATIDKMIEFMIESFQKSDNEKLIQEDMTQWAIEVFCEYLIGDDISKLLGETIETFVEFLIGEWKSYEDDFIGCGEFMVEGMIEGLEAKKSDLIAAVEALADEVNAAYEAKQEIQSPSKVWYQYGEYMVEGLADGMEASEAKAKYAATEVGTAVNNALEETLDETKVLVEGKLRGTMDILSKTMQSGVDTMINGPVIKSIKNGVVKAIVPLDELTSKIGKKITDTTAMVTFKVGKNVKDVQSYVTDAIRFVRNFDGELKKMPFDVFYNNLRKLTKYYKNVKESKLPDNVLKFLKDVDKGMRPVNKMVKNLAKSYYDFTGSLNKNAAALNKSRAAIVNVAMALGKGTEAYKEYEKQLEEVTKAEEDLAKAQEELAKAEESGKGIDSALEKVEECEEKLADLMDNLPNVAEVSAKIFNELFENQKQLLTSQLDFFNKYEKAVAIDSNMLLTNIKPQYEDMNKYGKALKQLAKEGIVDPSQITKWESQGMSALPEILGVMEMTPEQRLAWAQYAEKAGKVVEKNAKRALNAVTYALSEEGLALHKKLMNQNVEEDAKNYIKALNKWNKAVEDGNLKRVEKAISFGGSSAVQMAKNLNELLEPIGNVVNKVGKDFFGITDAMTDASEESSLLKVGILGVGDALGKIRESGVDADNMLQEFANHIIDLRQTIADNIAGLNPFAMMDVYSEDNQKTMSEVLDSLDSNINGVKQWRDDLTKVAETVGPEVAEKLAGMGIDAAGAIAHAMANPENEAQVGELQEKFKEWMSLSDDTADEITSSIVASGLGVFDSVQEQFAKAWEDSGKNPFRIPWEKVEEDYSTGASDVGRSTGETVVRSQGKAMTTAYQEEQPKMIEITKNSTAEAAEQGTSKASSRVKKAYKKNIVEPLKETFDNEIPEAGNEGTKKLVDNVAKKFKSMSKDVSENMSTALDRALELINTAAETARNQIDAAFSNMEYTVILHVDSTEIDAAIAKFNQAKGSANINAQQAGNAAKEAKMSGKPNSDEGVSTTNNSGTNITFNQTINSPKDTSITDIARGTQSATNAINRALRANSK